MKTEEEKKERKMRKLSRSYHKVTNDYNVNTSLPKEDQVREFVRLACDIQQEICTTSDKIRIDDLEKQQDIVPIDKSTYLDFVRIASLKEVGKLQEKAISKFSSDFEKRLLSTNLRSQFLDTYMSGEVDCKVTDEDNREFTPFSGYSSSEFYDQLEESAKKRIYINTVLRPRMNDLSRAAEYITNMRITGKMFKDLVDWEYYKEGGYPSPESPSKIWAIFQRYDYALRLLKEYGYDNTVDELNKEFGLNVETHSPVKTPHPWIKEESEID